MREPKDISIEEFKLMTELAGLGMDEAELEELKPIYDLYAEYALLFGFAVVVWIVTIVLGSLVRPLRRQPAQAAPSTV